MRLEDLKNDNLTHKINCQLVITEEHTVKNDAYLKLEFRDRTKIYINVFQANALYSKIEALGLNKMLFVEAELSFKGTNARGYDEYSIYGINVLQQPSLVDCVDVPRLIDELRTIMMGIQDAALKKVLFAMCNYKNKELLNKLFEAPVTERSAYSFKAGVLAHIVRLCRACDALGMVYNTWDFNLGGFNETLNVDLLKTVAMLHELGKAEKFYFENNQIKKSFSGELLNESQMSINLFHDILMEQEITLLPEQKILIEHAIASSKGNIDRGALCEPRTKEAEVFAALERIDGTMGNFEYLQRTNMGDDFQMLHGKQYFTTDFEEV